MKINRCLMLLTSFLLLAVAAGCIRIRSEPVTIEPIHVTVDVNLRIQRELVNVFDDIDAQDPTIQRSE